MLCPYLRRIKKLGILMLLLFEHIYILLKKQKIEINLIQDCQKHVSKGWK